MSENMIRSGKIQKTAIKTEHVKRYICLDLEMCELTTNQRRTVKELRGEVIQIGAVMLDENLNYISEFSSLVKPEYGHISNEISALTGINDNMVEHADTFSTAFYKFFCWAGSDDITTFCWSNSDYKQLWNEIHIKAKNHDEYQEFLRTFVDLQAVLGKALSAKKAISLDVALKFCHLKFKGQRHSALFDAYNTARILFKMKHSGNLGNGWDYIASNTESEMCKNRIRNNSFDKDYTTSFASFISPALLEKFGYSDNNENHQETSINDFNLSQSVTMKNKGRKDLLKKVFLCSRYGIKLSDWMKFSIRMSFVRDLKTNKPIDFFAA